MHILILGGTTFLGRHLVDDALARGHRVTIFHRGQTPTHRPQEVEELLGDRTQSLDLLRARTWDAVIDTSGYVPRHVRQSTITLFPTVPFYAFISTISVYPDSLPPDSDETYPVTTLADPATETVTGETYGGLKALCEQAVQTTYTDQALIIRPGLIVGPYDPTDRFTYWPVRIARGGNVLAPVGPDEPVQFIDVRDLAGFTLTLVERRQSGVYNATGPFPAVTLGDVIQTCQQVTHIPSTIIWVSQADIERLGIAPWTDLPLWVPQDAMPGFSRVNCNRALSAGLTFRSVQTTISDTLDWATTRTSAAPLKAGLSVERERAALRDLGM